MGCPDWPKCFGLWVPPFEYADVPLAYWNDPLSSENGKLVFNPIKTWTEYLNRLLGVVIGFSILIQFIWSFLTKANGKAKFYSAISFVLVVFQGWLGSKVVSTDLKPLIITIHLVVALLIACLASFTNVALLIASPSLRSMSLTSICKEWSKSGADAINFELASASLIIISDDDTEPI
jgi:cytochrome c oxidase assembly protein subunit 15